MIIEMTTHLAAGPGSDLPHSWHLGSERPHGIFTTVINNQANVDLPPQNSFQPSRTLTVRSPCYSYRDAWEWDSIP